MKKFSCLLLFLTALSAVIVMAGCNGDGLNAKGGSGGSIMPDNNDQADYGKLWKEVQEFNNKGLPKSALKTVEKIYQTAKEKKHAAEFVKAIIHKVRFMQEVEEDTFFKIHKELTGELEQSGFPVTPVLHSMLAEQYWLYYQNNRYRFMKRTAKAGAGSGDVKDDDIRTWDLRKIVTEVVNHYKKSLENPEESKQTRIDIYDKILYRGNTVRAYRPTLYDFLAHRAVDFFTAGEPGLTQPVYRFNLNKEDYFADAHQFAEMKISTRDPLSFDYFALTGLQELIRFHLKDENPAALVDVDLKRLRFLYREAVISNKEIIYEKKLRRMMETYGEVPITAEIYYELASLYNQLGEKYKPRISKADDEKEKYKWYKKKAHELCREAIKKYPGSSGAHNCQHLIDRIEGGQLD
ncbi:MAG: hypothetical protein GY950_36700, partial [bacterium]|nr:hypothetical protein [bacterium]